MSTDYNCVEDIVLFYVVLGTTNQGDNNRLFAIVQMTMLVSIDDNYIEIEIAGRLDHMSNSNDVGDGKAKNDFPNKF